MTDPSSSTLKPEPEGSTVQPFAGFEFRTPEFGPALNSSLNSLPPRNGSGSTRSTVRGLEVVIAGHDGSSSSSTPAVTSAPDDGSATEPEPTTDWIGRLALLGRAGRRAARANLTAQAAADLEDRKHATKVARRTAADVRRAEVQEQRRQRRAVLLDQFQSFWSPYVYVVCVLTALVGLTTVVAAALPKTVPTLAGLFIGSVPASGLEGMALSAMIIAIRRRTRGEKATGPRVMTWVFSGMAIAINGVGHMHQPVFAVITVSASLGALITYEMQAYDRIIVHLRALGVVAPLLPRYGIETVRHPVVVAAAKRIALRDPAMRTFELSYAAAEREVALRGIARAAVRRSKGRAVARAVLASMTPAELELRVAESVNPNHTLAAALDTYLNPKPEPQIEPQIEPKKKVQAPATPKPSVQENPPKPELPVSEPNPNPEADDDPKPTPNPNPERKVIRIGSADDTELLPTVLPVAVQIQGPDGKLPGEHKCCAALKTIGINRNPKRAKGLLQRALDEAHTLQELSA